MLIKDFVGGIEEFRLYLMIYSIKNGYKVNVVKNDREYVTTVYLWDGCTSCV